MGFESLIISSLAPFTEEGKEELVIDYARAQFAGKGFVTADVWKVVECLVERDRARIDQEELEILRSACRE